jgi:hypothetical protein
MQLRDRLKRWLGVKSRSIVPAHIATAFPPAHFNSAIVDVDELVSRSTHLWPLSPIVQGIDFNDASHRRVLIEVLAYGGGPLDAEGR